MFNEQQLNEIVAVQSRMEAKLDDLRTELLGNGQPGRIQRLEEEIESHSISIHALRRAQSYITGIGAALTFMFSSLQAILFGRS